MLKVRVWVGGECAGHSGSRLQVLSSSKLSEGNVFQARKEQFTGDHMPK